MESPCGKCERKGCGSYHDICEEYSKFRQISIDVYKKKKSEYELQVDVNKRISSMKTNRNSNGVGRSHKKYGGI